MTLLSQFGGFRVPGGARFRVPAPGAAKLTIVLHAGTGSAARSGEMVAADDGVWELEVHCVQAGHHYSYRIDDGAELPDPASRYQPLGVHGPSELIDPAAYEWHDG